MKTGELVDVREATRLTGLSAPTIYRLARQGRLKSVRVLSRGRRFDLESVLALVQEQPESSKRDLDEWS